MATLFQQSALTWTVAQQKVAAAAGAKGDADMLALAGDAINWALQRWNTAYPWPWLNSTVGINITAPVVVSGCATTTNSTSLTAASGFTGLPVASLITGSTGILPETLISSVTNDTTIVMTQAAAATTTNQTLTFVRADYALPTGFNRIYDLYLTGTPRPLIYTPQRDYDLSRPLNTPSTPTHYTLFHRQGGTGGSVVPAIGYLRFLPPPNAGNSAVLRYSRRIAIPTTGSDVLDFPEDYEIYLLAMAKSHFLADKGGQPERMQYWAGIGELGLKRAISLAGPPPDDQTGFQPPTGAQSMAWNPNATTPYWTT